jgi:peptidoglycan hydrolase-like protein with peptidoglycan-binding domain
MNRASALTTAAVTVALVALPAAASAEPSLTAAATTTTTTTPAATTPTTTPTTTTKAPAKKPKAPKSKPKPKPARLSLTLAAGAYHVGKQTLAIAGRAVRVDGRIAPYVAGETVVVHAWRGHKKIKDVTVSPKPTKTKQTASFSVSFVSDAGGPVEVAAVHRGTAQQARVEHTTALTVVTPSTSGPFVGLLQQKLAAVGYATPQDGSWGPATARAVLAFRKVNGLSRTSEITPTVVDRLLVGAGGFHVRYPQHGRHVEANLGQQVLALIDNGKVLRAYITSSGKPSTPTVLGTFHFYWKDPGTNAKGMVDSNYFIGGYAIHGYYDVPTYNASHGCLRIPIPDAASVFNWVRIGNIVDVYY